MRARARIVLAGTALLVLAVPALASASVSDDQALAERYAPVVRLVEQTKKCGHGEPYEPMDVNDLFGAPTVALRGPWSPNDLVKIGPAGNDLVGRYEYHLDFPGNPLDPGCAYERWSRRITAGAKPTVYEHVVKDPGYPNKLALQYWLFYAFNNFTNLHEGDWEMIQLIFDARDARQALGEKPVSIGYSSHEGAERSSWRDEKLEIVDGTHPVVYPAAGSHANKYTAALYLGSSADAGVGCDDTRGPHRELHPVVKTIPSDPTAAKKAFPWITFQGRWGELQKAFFNGPTGPNLKTQWTKPIKWSKGWRDRSYAVPTSGIFGTSATDFFCGAVAAGSQGLVGLLRNPSLTFLVIVALIVLLIFLVTRTPWRPVAPLRVARRRSWGQILSASGRMYVRKAPLFLAIGVLFIPLGFLISLLQLLLLGGFGVLGIDTTGESAGALVLLVAAVGTIVTLLGLSLVQAATASALVALDADRPIGPIKAYRLGFKKMLPLLGGLAVAVVLCGLLSVTVVLLPVAIWLAVRWMLFAQVVELEDRSSISGLRHSSRLVRGRWFRVASLVGIGGLLALVIGPLVGAILILLTDAPFALLNAVSGLVYALAMPFVALTTTYVYFDARVRGELEPEGVSGVLPAEIQLGSTAP